MTERKQVDHKAFERGYASLKRLEFLGVTNITGHLSFSVGCGSLMESRVGGGGQTASAGEGRAL